MPALYHSSDAHLYRSRHTTVQTKKQGVSSSRKVSILAYYWPATLFGGECKACVIKELLNISLVGGKYHFSSKLQDRGVAVCHMNRKAVDAFRIVARTVKGMSLRTSAKAFLTCRTKQVV